MISLESIKNVTNLTGIKECDLIMTQPQPQPGFDPARLYVWVKGLEGKVNNLLRELEVLKNDFVAKNNRLMKELKIMDEELTGLKHEQEQSLRKMDLILKELKRTAGAEELAVLKKYIDFWNPMHFVTQRDLERAIDARLELTKEINKPALNSIIPSGKNNENAPQK